MDNNWITVSEAENVSGFDENYIRSLARNGTVTAKKFGNTWMIDVDSIKKYAEGRDERAHMPKNVTSKQ